MTASAGSDVLIDMPITTTADTFWYSNNSTNYDLIVGPNATINKTMQSTGAGGYTYQGNWSGGSWRSRSGVPVTLDGATLGTTSFDAAPTLLLKANSSLVGYRGSATAGTTLQRAATGDLEVTIRSMDVATQNNIPTADFSTTSPVQITPTLDYNGHLTLRTSYLRILSGSIITDANSTVEVFSNPTAANRVMEFGSVGISGAGNLHLKMDAASHTFTVRRTNDYTGRTILERGILVIGSHQVTGDQRSGSGTFGNAEDTGTGYNASRPYGYELGTYYGGLPNGTVVEIGADATLRLNAGSPQTLGGLTGYNASFGAVQMQGAELTIDSQVSTAFGGAITGAGTLIKTGAETFTIIGDYTNPVDRTVRIEEGLFEVQGIASFALGNLELSGGQLLANSLNAANQTWSVALSNAVDGQRLTEVTNADITNAVLNLSLADNRPGLNSTFILVYASDSITGASAADMFGYEDGEFIQIDDYTFVINWVTGSESIVLTTIAIPEPGQVALAMALLSLLTLRFRRGKKIVGC